MGKKLHWIREAFSRKISIIDQEQLIGEMWQDALFSYDVEARLNDMHVLFDLKGFLKRSVNIHDLKNNRKIIGVIHFSFGRKAELFLPTRERYLWRRKSFFMQEWSLLRQSEETSQEVFHYAQLRSFFSDEGEISGIFNDKHSALLILSGLFIGNYFKRRRRRAAAAS